MRRLISVIGLAPSEDKEYAHRLQNERTRILEAISRFQSQRSVPRTVAPKQSKKTMISELQKEMERLGIKTMDELKKVLEASNA